MFHYEVVERCRRAKDAGKAYLAVCMDQFDYRRGDRDLGYYYPWFDSEAEVLDRIRNMPLGGFPDDNCNDICWAVVALRDWTETTHDDHVTDARDWVAARNGLVRVPGT